MLDENAVKETKTKKRSIIFKIFGLLLKLLGIDASSRIGCLSIILSVIAIFLFSMQSYKIDKLENKINSISSNNENKSNPTLTTSINIHKKSYIGISYNICYKDLLVYGVEKNSPAEKSGIIKGDYIAEMFGLDIDSANLELITSIFPPGTKGEILVLRNNKELNLTITLEEKQKIERDWKYFVYGVDEPYLIKVNKNSDIPLDPKLRNEVKTEKRIELKTE